MFPRKKEGEKAREKNKSELKSEDDERIHNGMWRVKEWVEGK